MQVHHDCVLILDKFPKAKHHALVIAREEGLDGPHLLRKEHLPLLQHMQVGRHGSYIWDMYCISI